MIAHFFQNNSNPNVRRSVLRSKLLKAWVICLTASGLFVTTATAIGSQTIPTQTKLQPLEQNQKMALQLLSPLQQSFICNILLGLAYFLPIGLGLGIFLHHRYVIYRSAVLKQQIEALERIWQKSPRF